LYQRKLLKLQNLIFVNKKRTVVKGVFAFQASIGSFFIFFVANFPFSFSWTLLIFSVSFQQIFSFLITTLACSATPSILSINNLIF